MKTTDTRIQCYWNRPQATAEAFLPDGWFRSGDLAKIDEEGFVYIVDRAKDIIVRGGENISCAQVENAVYRHPDILDCAVVSIPDKRLGERVAAVCVPRDPSKELPSEESIIEAAKKVLPKVSLPLSSLCSFALLTKEAEFAFCPSVSSMLCQSTSG